MLRSLGFNTLLFLSGLISVTDNLKIWCLFLMMQAAYVLHFFANSRALMVFSFLQRRFHPLKRCIIKLLTSPVIMYFLFEKDRTQILKRGMPCVYHLLRSVARSLLFRLHISSACFYNQKKFYNDNEALIM